MANAKRKASINTDISLLLGAVADQFADDGDRRKFYSVLLLGHNCLHQQERDSIERILTYAIGRDLVNQHVNPEEAVLTVVK
jgi:hypothetical protein